MTWLTRGPLEYFSTILLSYPLRVDLLFPKYLPFDSSTVPCMIIQSIYVVLIICLKIHGYIYHEKIFCYVKPDMKEEVGCYVSPMFCSDGVIESIIGLRLDERTAVYSISLRPGTELIREDPVFKTTSGAYVWTR